MSRAVVIGLTDPSGMDGGIGPAVVRALRRRAPLSVALAVCDDEPTRLCDLWGEADLAVVVDAGIWPASTPGRVHRRSLRHPSLRTLSGVAEHGRSLDRAVSLGAALDYLPGALLLYVVEPDQPSGAFPTAATRAAVASLADEIVDALAHRPVT